MRIICIGLNHKTAGVELREKLAFDETQSLRAMRKLKANWDAAEFAILSTCNRVELYAARAVHAHPREDELRHWLGEFHRLPVQEYERSLYTLADAKAAEHLFAVAAGLDSLVPGEVQILSQLRQAYALSLKARTAGAVLNELFQTALHAGKRVRAETGIARGRTSVAGVAVDCVRNVLGSLSDKTVVTVGAGEMNLLMGRHPGKLGAGRVLVVNRSLRRARQLARACSGRALPFEELGQALKLADVVLTSTAAGAPIITRKMIDSTQRKRRWRPMLIVDIAVPRDVEASAGGLKNVFLHNIDDLERLVRKNLRNRRSQYAKSEKLIAGHVEKFMLKMNVRNVAPTIEELYRRMREIAEDELDLARNKLRSHPDAEADAEILERALRRALRRILHPCVTNLRKEAGNDTARAHVAALRKLFDLDKNDPPSRTSPAGRRADP